jgi:hypothetical protein
VLAPAGAPTPRTAVPMAARPTRTTHPSVDSEPGRRLRDSFGTDDTSAAGCTPVRLRRVLGGIAEAVPLPRIGVADRTRPGFRTGFGWCRQIFKIIGTCPADDQSWSRPLIRASVIPIWKLQCRIGCPRMTAIRR